MDGPQVVGVGGSGTGGALAHDLVLRGLRVTLVERGELTSGTTGRHHGPLHSGARYAVHGDAVDAGLIHGHDGLGERRIGAEWQLGLVDC